MLKSCFMTVSLLVLALNNASAAQSEVLGSIWREGVKDDKTVWIAGTLRSIEDLDALSAAETQDRKPSDGKPSDGKPSKTAPPLHDAFLRFDAECSEHDFAMRLKSDAAPQEAPLITNESPYSFEDSPLREAAVIVNGRSSLNLRYLWGSMSGASAASADDRRNLAGEFYRFLKQIEQAPKSAITVYTPNNAASYTLDNSYQEQANAGAIAEFKQACGEFVSNWH